MVCDRYTAVGQQQDKIRVETYFMSEESFLVRGLTPVFGSTFSDRLSSSSEQLLEFPTEYDNFATVHKIKGYQSGRKY